MDPNYIKDLEACVKRMLIPMRDLPFNVIIKSISGNKVIPFQGEDNLIKLLKKSFSEAGVKANVKGIEAERANEVGNKIEPYVKDSLNNNKIEADVPKNKSGKRIAAGYPDILFSNKNKYYYLECKTYNQKNINTTQRSFYFSPSNNFKITKDAPHLMVAFQIIKRGDRYYVEHWRLYSLENLKVDLKHEFNQSNRKLYGDKSYLKLIEEEEIK